MFADAIGIVSQTICRDAVSGTTMDAGNGLSAGMSNGVPSGITPAARRKRELALLGEIAIDLQRGEAPGIRRRVAYPGFEEMFVIAVVLLEMVRTQKQPFRPRYLGVPRHQLATLVWSHCCQFRVGASVQRIFIISYFHRDHNIRQNIA